MSVLVTIPIVEYFKNKVNLTTYLSELVLQYSIIIKFFTIELNNLSFEIIYSIQIHSVMFFIPI
ncbi:hypothetical protein KSF78_0005383 [Schistosoma japonicum]|nr:hypothetical protein KSF78_0005383 [Schistosoma japonicum]